MRIVNWLLWRMWWLMRPKYLISVFVVAFRNNSVLLVKKRLGFSRNPWTVPGGVKSYNISLPEAVVNELREETGIVVRKEALTLVRVSSNEFNRDIHIVYALELVGDEIRPKPIDSREICEAQFISIEDAFKYMCEAHWKFVFAASARRIYLQTCVVNSPGSDIYA